MLTIGYFFLCFGIFLIFTILLTFFGYFIQYYLFPRFRTKNFSLLIFLESFGVGTAIFIFYSYFILDFSLFNFYTIYLPLIIFDFASILCFLRKNNLKEIIKQIKAKLKNIRNNQRIKRHIAFLILSFFLLLLVQGVIETNLSLPYNDPYVWFNQVIYLHRYGDLNYNSIVVHGIGFVIFDAGALLIINDFYVHYFFIKYVPIYLFLIMILALYNISRFFFKKNYEILISLIILLSFNSLMFRYLLGAPSALVIVLALIFFNTLIEKENYRIFLIRGFIVGGMFLITESLDAKVTYTF